MSKVVGLFGISGVGKTRLARTLIGRNADLLHLQASQLLKEEHNQTGEALRTSGAETVRDNQSVLAQAVTRARIGRETDPVLLDAHSVIDNDEGYVEIPVSAIRGLGLTHIFFLAAEPGELLRRRQGDERKRPERSQEQLQSYQDLARDVCSSYARDLRLPYQVLCSAEEEAAESVEAVLR